MCCLKPTFLVKQIKKYIGLPVFVIGMCFGLYKSFDYIFPNSILVLTEDFPSLFISKSYAAEIIATSSVREIKCEEYCEYKVKSGDNLSNIFKKLKIKNAATLIKQLDEADAELLRLDSIQPGYLLRFWLKEQMLQKFEMEINVAQKIQYKRKNDASFDAEEINIEGEWIQTVALGTVKNNFFVSATTDGMLTSNEYQVITDIFKDKINFARDLHAGDKFAVMYKTHMVGNKESGQTEIIAANFKLKKKTVSAYRHKDGNYYNENGEGLQGRSFLLYPLEKKARISSHFNPSRVHPVTGSIRPHNGTDFAVDIGTPVIASADGIVTIVRDHPYAGKYLVIDHGTQYKTRYLHNSRILVKKGDRVVQGQRIALSGKTGRVSGAHLHYEVLINNRPVDAMKSGFIPLSTKVPKKDMPEFRKMVANNKKELGKPSVRVIYW